MQARGQRAAVCQVDGGRWLSLEGPVRLVSDPDGVRAGVEGYASRYRQPKERDDRVVIEISVERILGRGRRYEWCLTPFVTSAGVSVPGELGDPSLSSRVRIHGRVVDRPFELRVEMGLAAWTPVQDPVVLAHPPALDGVGTAGQRCTFRPYTARPPFTEGSVIRRAWCRFARNMRAAVLTTRMASRSLSAPTGAYGLSSVAHSTSHRYTLPTPHITR